MKIVKESLMIIPVLILVGPSNVYAKHSSSTSSTSSSSGITGLSTTTPSNYATKPGAFLSKSNFTSNAAQSVFVARETLVETGLSESFSPLSIRMPVDLET